MTDIKIIKEKLVNDLKNFCAQNGFTDVMFGLSGGMDSALVLALAVEALGPEHVHTLMMKTKYTSQQSIDLANEIAKNMGNHHETIDIQPAVDEFAKTIQFTPKRSVTMENLQSRIRGIITMTYSNDFNWLVLACGNKSEASMGYCTLYGDTCGGVMPIGDLYKTQVYEMADLYNREGKFIIPDGIINRAPSAELAHDQKDSDSLPEYEVLDPILAHIESGAADTDIENKELVNDIRRRYNAMEFKRRQCPPVLKTKD